MLQCNTIWPARISETGISSPKRTFKMHFFKTEASIPQTLRSAGRTRFYRAALRYGHARLGKGDQATDVATPAPALVELPRVQAVVDAIIYARAA